MMFWKKKDKSEAKPQPVVEDVVPVVAEPVAPLVEDKKSWTQRLTSGLSQSSQKLTQGLVDVVTKKPLDQDGLDRLEELLIMADLGPSLAARLVEEFARTRFGKEVTPAEIKTALAEQVAKILQPVAQPLKTDTAKPFVALMVGVNGSGKTTTIGKLSQQLSRQDKKIVLAAGDTFRAAAVEQLQLWGTRTNATVIAKGLNTDSAAVAFEAIEKATAENADVVLIDTAGRLHNKANLMEELSKISRVIKKQLPEAPHAVLLTLDATIGQNAMTQIEQFNAAIPLTGLVVTKLDGSARGGIVVALAERFKLPIIAVGVGEGAEDLQPFDPIEFSRALLGV
jgi:fused signal recognition particle receptor